MGHRAELRRNLLGYAIAPDSAVRSQVLLVLYVQRLDRDSVYEATISTSPAAREGARFVSSVPRICTRKARDVRDNLRYSQIQEADAVLGISGKCNICRMVRVCFSIRRKGCAMGAFNIECIM